MSGLPEQGLSADEVRAELDHLTTVDEDWRSSKMLHGVWLPGQQVHELAAEAYARFLNTNALYFDSFPSLTRMEADLVGWTADLLQAPRGAAGNVTSGGTESIMLAVRAARGLARTRRPELGRGTVVLPVSAHPAFHKAADYLGLDVVTTPLDPRDGHRADVAAFSAALDERTVLAVGSAPNFSHGTVDRIDAMSEAARARRIPFHVDACVGGFFLPFARAAGRTLPGFDFSLPGVTSMSADLHKFGYAPKNASVVLYRDRELRSHAWFVCSSTTEYAVINPTVQSSRTGGPTAAAWATMRHLGREGYATRVERCLEAMQTFVAGVDSIEGISVLSPPDMSLCTLVSDDLSVFELHDLMKARGWGLVPQFRCEDTPENLHVTFTAATADGGAALVEDLRSAVAELRESGPSFDRPALEAAVQRQAEAPLMQLLAALLPLAGMTGEGLPDRMAPLNTMLNALPARRRDEVLAMYLGMTR